MSRRWIACCFGALLLTALGGCRTVSQTQFQIPESAGSNANRERVVALVQDVAISAGMIDLTARSKADHTLAYFEEPVKSFRTTLAARSAGDYLVIDLGCFHPGRCESTTFSVTKTLLEQSLQREFGDHWRLVTDGAERIPVTRN
jgi:hypothetical protein